jgi:hypothetical protein
MYVQSKKWPKNMRYFSSFRKTTQSNNRPLGDNSPNLVTLLTESLSIVSW